MNKVKPIKPEEVKTKREFPDFVIEAFNELIQNRWNEDKGRSIVKQEDAIQTIIEKSSKYGEPINRGEIFSNKYLDVEDVYRENGWVVEYMKQPYYSDEDDFFVFKKECSKDN